MEKLVKEKEHIVSTVTPTRETKTLGNDSNRKSNVLLLFEE